MIIKLSVITNKSLVLLKPTITTKVRDHDTIQSLMLLKNIDVEKLLRIFMGTVLPPLYGLSL